jgi:mannose-6-phosphate isomerase
VIDTKLEDSEEDHNSAANRALLKELFACFMHAPDDLVNAKIAQLIGRISIDLVDNSTTDNTLSDVNSLIVHLHNDFSNDRGVLCPLLLNYVRLKAGEAFFMGANEPHAYLSGDCLECMALSDNTVRAGLTPKHKDVDTLISMLHYRWAGPRQ